MSFGFANSLASCECVCPCTIAVCQAASLCAPYASSAQMHSKQKLPQNRLNLISGQNQNNKYFIGVAWSDRCARALQICDFCYSIAQKLLVLYIIHTHAPRMHSIYAFHLQLAATAFFTYMFFALHSFQSISFSLKHSRTRFLSALISFALNYIWARRKKAELETWLSIFIQNANSSQSILFRTSSNLHAEIPNMSLILSVYRHGRNDEEKASALDCKCEHSAALRSPSLSRKLLSMEKISWHTN